jgi:glycosyltransferase involved in cell wall biosynthesis
VLYICIPAYNEAQTVGVLLWRIRKVFEGIPREYEILVYNDASTDATSEILAPYAEVLPLTVLGGDSRLGYAGAVSALLREAAQRTRYARRDAVILMQADFTDQPEHLPELVKRFEGGADIVVAERPADQSLPVAERRLRRVAPWLLKPFVTLQGVNDPFTSFRLYRVAVVRDALKASPEQALASAHGWGANVELLLSTMPHARRVESVAVSPRFDLRVRESRIKPFADAMTLYRFGRRSRGRTAAVAAKATA